MFLQKLPQTVDAKQRACDGTKWDAYLVLLRFVAIQKTKLFLLRSSLFSTREREKFCRSKTWKIFVFYCRVETECRFI